MRLHSHIAFRCSGKSIYQWNIKNGETTIKKLVQDSNVLTIAANPKGMLIASADVNTQINIWDWQKSAVVNILLFRMNF